MYAVHNELQFGLKWPVWKKMENETMHQVFEQWQERDPQSAEATWNAAPISTEQRQELGKPFVTRTRPQI